MVTIEAFTSEIARNRIDELVVLLQDTVENGASVGFLSPLMSEDAHTYWHEVIEGMAGGNLLLWGALADGRLVGSVQLELARRMNGLHRAEVQKLMVHTAFRRRGIARRLLDVVEAEARCRGRTLLVLDTRQGDAAEQLYIRCGYTPAGVIPEYARSANGELHSTVYFYRLIQD